MLFSLANYLSMTEKHLGGASSRSWSMVVVDGHQTKNHIDYVTIPTLGDAQDFGDLVQSGMDGDVGHF